jgi:hypothetical protein
MTIRPEKPKAPGSVGDVTVAWPGAGTPALAMAGQITRLQQQVTVDAGQIRTLDFTSRN